MGVHDLRQRASQPSTPRVAASSTTSGRRPLALLRWHSALTPGLGPDGCKFLLVFNDGNYNEFETFLLSDWFHHTPKEILAKNFGVPASTFDRLPEKELFIFVSELPKPLAEDQRAGTGSINDQFVFRAGGMRPTKVRTGGELRIVDHRNFPATHIAAAILRLKPGGLRELHWHPLSDDWQYYVSGKGA